MFISTKFKALIYALVFMTSPTVIAREVGALSPSCPSLEFSAFLDTFSSSSSTQELFTKQPLHKTLLVDGDPEPIQKTLILQGSDIDFPIIPDPIERQREGLILRPLEIEGKHAKALLEKPDTDFRVIYSFQLENCWQLTEIQDDSF